MNMSCPGHKRRTVSLRRFSPPKWRTAGKTSFRRAIRAYSPAITAFVQSLFLLAASYLRLATLNIRMYIRRYKEKHFPRVRPVRAPLRRLPSASSCGRRCDERTGPAIRPLETRKAA